MICLYLDLISGICSFLFWKKVILCVPKNGAQELADRLVSSGIKGIWNFAPMDLDVPSNIIVENVNLTESLFTLSYLMKED